MAFPGKSWTKLKRDPQKMLITGVLNTESMGYFNCDIDTGCPEDMPVQSTIPYYADEVKCSQCASDKPIKDACLNSISPCQIEGVCQRMGQPVPNPCQQKGNVPLYNRYSTIDRTVQYDGGGCYKCKAVCQYNRACRGQVNMTVSMDLGHAIAWTLKNRKPVETTDLELKTYVTSAATMLNASANVSYYFDLENIEVDNAKMSNLAQWIDGLRYVAGPTSSVSTNHNGPGSIDNAFPTFSRQARDAAMILGIVNFCYDAMVGPRFPTNTFMNGQVNVMSSNAILRFLAKASKDSTTLFTTGQDYKNVDDVARLMDTFIRAPTPSLTKDSKKTPILTVNVSYKQLLMLLADPTQISVLVCRFLRDQEGKIRRPGASPTKADDPVLIFPGFTAVKAIRAVLVPGNYHLATALAIDKDGFVVSGDVDLTDSVIAQYQLACTVQRWSVLLMAYFQEAADVAPEFSTDTCALMVNQVPLIARTCYENVDPDQQQVYAKKSCGVQYTPPGGVQGMEQWLVYTGAINPVSGDKTCVCFNTNLGRPSDTTDADSLTSSRCFSVQCDPSQREDYGLTDQVCAQQDKCAQMERWVASKDPFQRGVDIGDIDWVRFSLLCGKTIQAVSDVTYDWKMAIAIAASLIVVVFLLMVFLRKVRLGEKEFWGLTIFLLLLAIGMGVGSGWVFAGEPKCQVGDGSWPRKSICQSRLLRTPLLQFSCPLKAQCECEYDDDCSTSCACTAGFCISSNGQRKTTTTNQLMFVPHIFFPMIILAMAMPVIFASTLKSRISLRWLIPFCIVSAVLFLGIALGLGFRDEKDVLKFEDEADCVQDFPPAFTVLDVQRQILVTFPSRSVWTATGFPGEGLSSQENPFQLAEEILPDVVDAVKNIYPEFDMKGVRRAMAFVDNTASAPRATSFYVLEMFENPKGNTIALSRVQDITNRDIFKWTVAWGKVSAHLDKLPILPTELSVGSIKGALYSYVTQSGDSPKLNNEPLMAIGPTRIDKTTDLAFFTAAENALGTSWDGLTYQRAVRTLHVEKANPFFYALQVDANLTCACTFDDQFVCQTGQGSVDISTLSCKPE
jgi:hypothetical protein